MVGVWVELLRLIVEACKCLEKAGVDVDCKVIVCVWNWMVSLIIELCLCRCAKLETMEKFFRAIRTMPGG